MRHFGARLCCSGTIGQKIIDMPYIQRNYPFAAIILLIFSALNPICLNPPRMHKLLPAALILITVLCFDCKKNNSSPGGGNNLQDVKYIFVSVGDSTGGGVICINPDKTTRWVRTGLAEYTPTWVYYSDGIIYAPYSEYNAATAEGHGNFYAIDAATGKDVWTIKHSANIFYNVYIHNGTLYAYVQTVAGFYIAALNAKTGQQQWRVPINASWVADFMVDGNTLYFNEDVSPTNISLTAFNLTTKTIMWQTQTNNYTNSYTGLIIKDNYVYVRGLHGAVSAVEKSTGKVAWTTGSISKTIIYNSGSMMYYINDANRLCALNISNGNGDINWQAPAVVNDAHIHLAGQRLYVTGSNANPAMYVVYAANVQDGSMLWQKQFDNLQLYPVAVGSNLYLYDGNTKTIAILDAATGNQKDAILLNTFSRGYCQVVTTSGKLVTPD